ncbi:MAG: hypothetical protein G3M70_14885 [Candidatus Nitronauta litoralis]|uniref:Uncharacterized protein n=1 Tax=Candidatus Nitronauta litoralis TaxID=2705533 RepID=A0A7T0BY42_9BACT|nr:MAG: hypothetical protein G3M70_14885 [Candidatus Nitronauta litoralis]
MTTSDQNPEEEKPASNEDKLEAIKQEEKEDASTYYAQGSSGEKGLTEADFKEPVPPVDPEEEEMSLLKAVAFLGFGMAALAIIFILFFIRDLNSKVGDVDAAIQTIETKFGPIKQTMESGFARIDQDVSDLKGKVGNYEKMVAVMELKRAKVAIQEVTANSDPELQSKSGQLIANIDSLLNDLGAGDGSAPLTMAVPPAAAPEDAAPAPEPEPAHEPEPAPEPAEEAAVEEEPAAEEDATGVIELASEGESEESEESEDSGESEESDESEGEEEGGEEEGEDDEEEEDE